MLQHVNLALAASRLDQYRCVGRLRRDLPDMPPPALVRGAIMKW